MLQKHKNTAHRLSGFIVAATAACGILFAGAAYAETVLLGVAHGGPDDPSFLYQIDPSTGKATAIGSGIGFERISGMDFDPSTGTLYATGEKADGSDRVILITIDPTTGVGTEVGLTGVEFFRGIVDSATITDIAFRPSDSKLFAYNFPSFNRNAGIFGGLSTINLNTGAATLIDHTTKIQADNGSALAFTPDGVLLHGAGEEASGFNCQVLGDCDEILHSINTTTAVAKKLTELSFPKTPAGVAGAENPRPNGMDFHPDTGKLFASVVYNFSSTSHFLATINPTNGSVTIIGETIHGLDALAFVEIEPGVTSDFDGDDDSDIFWRHAGDGRNKLWKMDGLTREAVGAVPKLSNTDWQVAGLGDFTGDRKTDVLWRNEVTGANKLWEMDGEKRVSNKNLPNFANTDWVVAGVGDFFDNGMADIFWHNTVTAANKIWKMDGATRVSQGNIPKFTNTKWQPMGVGDFNANGKVDILWRHKGTGANKIWPMNGFTRVANASIPAFADTNWQVAGLGDFDKDGKIDILWRNKVSGANKIWLMNGTSRKAQSKIPKFANTDWDVVGTGDYDASNESDILWRNGVSGANKIWLMEGFTRTDQSNIPKFGDTQWEVQR